jgi:hypothetical protein
MFNFNQIRTLIGEGKVKEALSEMLTLLENSDRRSRKIRDGVIILRSKFQDLSRKESLGLIDPELLYREKAQINDSLLSIINELESEPIPSAESGSTQSRKWLWLLLLIIPIGLVGVFYESLFPGGGTSSSECDLTFEGWSWKPDPVIKGEVVNFVFGIKNEGPEDAQNFEVHWWADIKDDQPTRSWDVNQLTPGQSRKFEFQYSYGTGSAGSLTSRIQLDPKNELKEANRKNNSWERAIKLKEEQAATSETEAPSTTTPPAESQPAATRSELSFVGYKWSPNPVIKGQLAKLTFEIKNNGPEDAQDFRVVWWANTQSEQPLKSWTVHRLRRGEQKKFEFQYTWPVSSQNSVTSGIQIDPERKINENDRRDNTWRRSIAFQDAPSVSSTTRCDVRVRAWQWHPDPVVKGQITRVMFDLINDGPEVAKNFKVYWYALSSDARPTQSWDVVQMEPGTRKSFEFRHQWLASAPTPLSFKVVIDPEQTLGDSDRTNNVKIVRLRSQ